MEDSSPQVVTTVDGGDGTASAGKTTRCLEPDGRVVGVGNLHPSLIWIGLEDVNLPRTVGVRHVLTVFLDGHLRGETRCAQRLSLGLRGFSIGKGLHADAITKATVVRRGRTPAFFRRASIASARA